ncbi:nuclease-related domain-containing protein [Alkalibacillus aidingensis]|uniref:nuclease-related domain-containing protein n=1 Tax=Alkalibacillus aidingensis TaxID=2747607 RepID=UPI001660E5ED|nr:nuclease-related domain-containing protein [Alkalibacillus aidingensis]
MLYKPRSKPTELKILESLHDRMDLSTKDKHYFRKLKRGYEGEVLFDSFTAKLQSDCLILNDLLFKSNNTTFQIDSLIIKPTSIYLYEIKNLEGDYYYDSDQFFKKPRYEITNPLHQIACSQSLFQHLLLQQGFKNNIDASVVFINPTFTLYQAPLNQPLIFPTQVKRHLTELDSSSTTLNNYHKRLADKLISLHITESPVKNIPDYEYNQLRKGMKCPCCGSFEVYVEGRRCICSKCTHAEFASTAIIRSTEELMLLFPNMRITTSIIHDWCQVIDSEKRVRRVLDQHLVKVGTNRWAYYQAK